MAASTMTQKVYRYIKESIVKGHYAPGDWLQEIQISTDLGVSRSPVREALRLLVGDGFLVHIPNKGIFVRTFQEKELHDIFELRFCMEEIGIHGSVGKITLQVAQELQGIIAHMEQAMVDGDIARYGELDFDLHTRIVAFSDNEIYRKVYHTYNHFVTPFRVFCIADPARAQQSMAEHAQLVDALIQGNMEQALSICQYHLEENSKVALEYITATASTAPTSGRTMAAI